MNAVKLAGLMITRNYDPLSQTFHVLRKMVDFTAVLDDGSGMPFPFADMCDEYLYLRRSGKWHDTGNRLTLLMRAYLHECSWAIVTGGDILPSVKLYRQVRQIVEEANAATPRPDIVMVPLRELWGGITQYRVDRLWGNKVVAGLTRCWSPQEAAILPQPYARLHGYASSVAAPVRRNAPDGCVAYHFGSIDAVARRSRVLKYAEEDPGNLHQADYTYLEDERGAVLVDTPPEDVEFLKRVMYNTVQDL